MQKVQKTVAAVALIVSLFVAFPASAAPNGRTSRAIRNVIERIIHLLDDSKYSFPPG